MHLDDLFEQQEPQELTGYLDPQALVSLLPDVNSKPDFTNALNKLRLGRQDLLTMPEKMQLASGFISFIRAEPQQKQGILRILMGVHGPTTAPKQTMQPTQPAGTPPTAAAPVTR